LIGRFLSLIKIKARNLVYNIFNMQINKIEDVNPKKLAAIKSWFKVVKVYDGKKPNTIAYNEKIFTK